MPTKTKRQCTHCNCDDDTLQPGAYWINDTECSTCVDIEKALAAKPNDGSNDEYANER